MRQVSVKWMMENAEFADLCAYSCAEEMWDRKLNELGDKFIDSVKREGIVALLDFNPDTNILSNGHHRLLIAWLLDIEYIGVTDTRDEGNSYEKQKEGFPICYEE